MADAPLISDEDMFANAPSGNNAPSEMSDDEMFAGTPSANPDVENDPGAAKVIARKAGTQILPAAVGGLAGVAADVAIGGALGSVPGAVAGLAAGLGGAYLASKGQDVALKKTGLDKTLGLTPEQDVADEAAHPIAAKAGELAGNAVAFGLSPEATIAQRLMGGAGMAAIEGGVQLASGNFDPGELAVAAAEGAFMNKPRSLIKDTGDFLGANASRFGTKGAQYRQPTAQGANSTPKAVENGPTPETEEKAEVDKAQDQPVGGLGLAPENTKAPNVKGLGAAGGGGGSPMLATEAEGGQTKYKKQQPATSPDGTAKVALTDKEGKRYSGYVAKQLAGLPLSKGERADYRKLEKIQTIQNGDIALTPEAPLDVQVAAKAALDEPAQTVTPQSNSQSPVNPGVARDPGDVVPQQPDQNVPRPNAPGDNAVDAGTVRQAAPQATVPGEGAAPVKGPAPGAPGVKIGGSAARRLAREGKNIPLPEVEPPRAPAGPFEKAARTVDLKAQGQQAAEQQEGEITPEQRAEFERRYGKPGEPTVYRTITTPKVVDTTLAALDAKGDEASTQLAAAIRAESDKGKQAVLASQAAHGLQSASGTALGGAQVRVPKKQPKLKLEGTAEGYTPMVRSTKDAARKSVSTSAIKAIYDEFAGKLPPEQKEGEQFANKVWLEAVKRNNGHNPLVKGKYPTGTVKYTDADGKEQLLNLKDMSNYVPHKKGKEFLWLANIKNYLNLAKKDRNADAWTDFLAEHQNLTKGNEAVVEEARGRRRSTADQAFNKAGGGTPEKFEADQETGRVETMTPDEVKPFDSKGEEAPFYDKQQNDWRNWYNGLEREQKVLLNRLYPDGIEATMDAASDPLKAHEAMKTDLAEAMTKAPKTTSEVAPAEESKGIETPVTKPEDLAAIGHNGGPKLEAEEAPAPTGTINIEDTGRFEPTQPGASASGKENKLQGQALKDAIAAENAKLARENNLPGKPTKVRIDEPLPEADTDEAKDARTTKWLEEQKLKEPGDAPAPKVVENVGDKMKRLKALREAAKSSVAPFVKDESGSAYLHRIGADIRSAMPWAFGNKSNLNGKADPYNPTAYKDVRSQPAKMSDDFNKLVNKGMVTQLKMNEMMDGLVKSDYTPEEFHQAENLIVRRGRWEDQPQRIQDLFTNYIRPLQQMYRDIQDDLYTRHPNVYGGVTPTEGEKNDFLPRWALKDQPQEGAMLSDPTVHTRNLSTYAPALQQRDFFQIHDSAGNSYIVSDAGKKGIYIWQGSGKPPRLLRFPHTDLKVNDKLQLNQKGKATEFTVDHAPTDDIEAVTDMRYVHNPVLSLIRATQQLSDVRDTADFLEDMWNNKSITSRSYMGPAAGIPKGYRKTILEEMGKKKGRTVYWDPKLANIFDDYVRPGFGTIDGLQHLRNANYAAANALYFFGSPVHILNEMGLWAVARGFDWLDPTEYYHMVTEGLESMKSVANQDGFYRDSMAAGANPMLANVMLRNGVLGKMQTALGGQLIKNPSYFDPITKATGVDAPAVGRWMMDNIANKPMWYANDMLFQSILRRNMRQKPNLTFEQAIRKTHEIMSDYREREGTIMGNRLLQQFLMEPAFSWFSRYHLGLMRSMGHMIHNLTTPDNPGDRVEAVGQILALGALTWGFGPWVNDQLQQATGNPNIGFRPRGMSTVLNAAEKVYKNPEDLPSAAMQVWTPSIPARAIMEAPFNRKLYNGENIIPPFATPGLAAAKVADYAAETAIPPLENAATLSRRPDAGLWDTARRFAEGSVGIAEKSPGMTKFENSEARRRQAALRANRRAPSGPFSALYNEANPPR
jgi:hypothetical protein